MKVLGIYFLVVNVITFLLYGIDKRRARRNKWRVPEKTLIMVAVLGGSLGALSGMKVFRHKTKKRKFSIGVPVIFLIQIIVGLYFSQL